MDKKEYARQMRESAVIKDGAILVSRELWFQVAEMIENSVDVDEVVEQIKDASYQTGEWNAGTQSFNLRMIEEDEAIEIVKGGITT